MIGFLPESRLFVDEALPSDIDRLVEIHAGGFRRGWSSDEFDHLIADPAVTALALRRQSIFGRRRILGFVLVRTVADEAEVLTVAVDLPYRGQSHGRRLMEAVLRSLYSERVPELFLEVDQSNVAAVTLYRKLGFVEVGRRKGYYADGGQGGTALVLKLQLRPETGPGRN